MRRLEALAALLIVLLMVWATWVVLNTASTYERREYVAEPYQAPTIPQCDQPLWERVKDRCK